MYRLPNAAGTGISDDYMPHRDCPPPTVPGAAAPAPGELAAQAPACQPGRSYFTSHGSGGHWSRSIFSSGTSRLLTSIITDKTRSSFR
jgi:hypothetical protein